MTKERWAHPEPQVSTHCRGGPCAVSGGQGGAGWNPSPHPCSLHGSPCELCPQLDLPRDSPKSSYMPKSKGWDGTRVEGPGSEEDESLGQAG